MKKVLYFDCETTGLDPVKNDIVQLAAIVEVDGEVKDEINLTMQPWSWEDIQPKALEVHGMDVEQLRDFQHPSKAFTAFIGLLGRYVNKFEKSDKFYPAGYNVRFDLDFLSQWFKKCGDNYFGSWQNWRGLDPLPLINIMAIRGDLTELPNHKLETVAEHFGIKIEAHDALSDVRATRELLGKLSVSRNED